MSTEKITSKHFDSLLKKFGSHTSAAKILGVTQSHYAYVRRTRRMSGPLRALILELCADESGHPLPSPTSDPQEA